MSQLLHNGIRGVMQNWFKFYMSTWKQYVSVKNCISSMSNITLIVGKAPGYAQHLLLILYINDMIDQMRFVHLLLSMTDW